MNNQCKRYNNFISSIFPNYEYDFSEKKSNIYQHVLHMLNQTQSMFSYENLPDTIPANILELYLQINGNVCFYKYNSELYVFTGGIGGPPDVYYRPTIYTIANTGLNISKSLKIGEECVVVPNDSLYIGLMPLFTKYATALTETELSIDIATVNTRVFDLISAQDDRTKVSAEKYLQDVRDGKQGVIAESAFLDGLKAQPYGTAGNHNVLTSLIELEQYHKASFYNAIGLNANYNMKRESLNTTESQMNNDALLPLVDNMLHMRKIGIEEVNSLYGTNISVDLSSSWLDNVQEIELEHKEIDGTIEETSSEEVMENEEIE